MGNREKKRLKGGIETGKDEMDDREIVDHIIDLMLQRLYGIKPAEKIEISEKLRQEIEDILEKTERDK